MEVDFLFRAREIAEEEDIRTLRQIVAALGEVGSQLDAADRVRGHTPWEGIARQEAAIQNLTARLSGRFRRRHRGLVERLSTCAVLHLAWGGLQDEVRQVTASMERQGG
jgi:hypothetical protein